MPSYKTHSIHGEVVMPNVRNRVAVDKEELKLFCMGPDPLMYSSYKTFNDQHRGHVRDFFTSMIIDIKNGRLQDDAQTMAFLYGQIDHLVLDAVMHPLIYYMTAGMKTNAKLSLHGQVEIWMDDYVEKKQGKTGRVYYKAFHIGDTRLRDLIDRWYKEVFGIKHGCVKYNIGYATMVLFDMLVKRNALGLIKPITKLVNVGDVCHSEDLRRVEPFLNEENGVWLDPETSEAYHESFDDLWNKSVEISSQTMDDVNNYIYRDKPFSNNMILNDTSYNTGYPCGSGQTLRFIKRYKD